MTASSDGTLLATAGANDRFVKVWYRPPDASILAQETSTELLQVDAPSCTSARPAPPVATAPPRFLSVRRIRVGSLSPRWTLRRLRRSIFVTYAIRVHFAHLSGGPRPVGSHRAVLLV